MELSFERPFELAGRLRRSAQKLARGLLTGLKTIMSDRMGAFGLTLLVICGLVALFAPWLGPYGPYEVNYREDGSVVRLEPPSRQHWLGTTSIGYDVFSQWVLGFRMAFVVGGLAALGSVLIGTNLGLISGYFGGWTDQLLMRMTDLAYGIPFIPFSLIFLALAGPSVTNMVIVITLFLWRTTARVVRAQVLSLRERPFVWVARAAGARDMRIVYLHIAPNVMPLAFLYMAFGVASGVMMESGLSFLGFGDPLTPTWGQMLNGVFTAGAIRRAWWWALPPGLALSLFVTATYMVTRAYEEIANPRLREIH